MKKAATLSSNGPNATSGTKIIHFRKSRAVKLLEDMANADARQRMPEVPYLAPRTFTDVIGNQRTIGSMTWIPGTGTNGTADISATIGGRSVKIEVKIGHDRQSEAQRRYQQQVEGAGGLYIIARTFEQFYQWYIETFNK